MVNQQDISWAKIATAAGGIAILALALPFIYYAFLASLGLLGIGITAGIGIAAIKALPWLGQKWENKLLALRKSEARTNPIEQMQNKLKFEATQLNNFKNWLTDIGGQIRGLEDSLVNQKKIDPTEDFSQQEKDLSVMKNYFQEKRVKYTQACESLEGYKKTIERCKFKYGFGTAAQGIANAMNVSDIKRLTENMLADEAYQAAEQRYNSAFAALEIDAVELKALPVKVPQVSYANVAQPTLKEQ